VAHSISHAPKRSGLWDYLTTVDHKKIAILYLFTGIFYLLVGGIEALLMRTQLLYPNNDIFVGSTFNQLMTMHGTTMIFFAAMPLLFALMNAAVPLQIGARDVAFPFLNALGFWLFFFGALLTNISWFWGGAPEAGWTAYLPLAGSEFTGTGLDFYAIGLQISGAGTLLGGINFLATIINMRAPGMTFMRMPLFTWTTFVSSLLILFAFPPLTVALFLMIFDRIFGSHFFDVAFGGNVIIWEHLFWIFGHPEVYILVLPAFGVFSEIFTTFSRKRLFGYHSMVFATLLIGFLSFMVWVHHMFTVGMGPVANAIFSVATAAIAVPTGIKVFNWLFTMWGGQVRFTATSLWAIFFIPSFVFGGVTGVMLALPAADLQYHDTYFVVAHFHYVIVGGVVLGIFGGLYYWWPKMFGRKLDETLGKWHFWLFFIGFHLTFFIQHFLGLWGMPRRVFTYLPNLGLDTGNFVSSIGAYLMGASTIIFAINVIITWRRPADAGNDPWDGRTLEWAIPSPPPEYNFAQLPLVRGLDPLWVEKMEGRKEMIPAEPLGDIHMPNPSFLPFMISLGLFISGLGWIYKVANEDQAAIGIAVGVIGLLITIGSMFLRSVIDDHGYHIHADEIKGGDKGVKA